jgi:hypothetical protein
VLGQIVHVRVGIDSSCVGARNSSEHRDGGAHHDLRYSGFRCRRRNGRQCWELNPDRGRDEQRYFFQVGRSAMEYQLGRLEPSLRLLQGVNPERLASFDDPRERLTHSYRS